ncbi:MAG: hypothetical protein IAI49_03240 [Candidatus Eremiobacteraeota bacterium]|nr:hypothetical protein [Candidatus Eremiobacteraeota bacterium]
MLAGSTGSAAAGVSAVGDASDWALPGGDLANHHFSALRSIDVSNVARLKPRWTFHTGISGGFEATPIVIDGIMYVSTAGDDVVALDAASARCVGVTITC